MAFADRAIRGRIDQCSQREADQLRPTLRLPRLLPFYPRSGRGVQRNLLPALRRSPQRQLRAAPHSTARRSPRARSAHKPSRSRAGGEQCSASAPGPPYVWLRDRGDVRICNRRRAKSHAESWRYILRAAYSGSLNIAKSKHRQACNNPGLHGCRPEEPEHGCRIDCIEGSQRKAPHFPPGSIAMVGAGAACRSDSCRQPRANRQHARPM